MAVSTDHELLTIAEAAKLVRVDKSTIRRWIKSERLHPLRLGERTIRIRRSELADSTFESGHDIVALQQDDSTRPSRFMSAERQRRHADVLEQIAVTREQLAERNGPFEKESWELLNEMRDERTRQLVGEE